MKNQVKVAVHPDTGNVITPGKTEGYGAIRVDQEFTSLENGFANISKRSAFINGTMENLEALGFKEDQIISGNILISESTTPFYDGQAPKMNPETEETVVDAFGSAIYRDYTYTADISRPDGPLVASASQATVAVSESATSEEVSS